MQEINNGVQLDSFSLELENVIEAQSEKQTRHLLVNTLKEVLDDIFDLAEQCEDYGGTTEILSIARKITKVLVDVASS